MIFQGIRTSIAKTPYIFVILAKRGGGGVGVGIFALIVIANETNWLDTSVTSQGPQNSGSIIFTLSFINYS